MRGMSNFDVQKRMLKTVAAALGESLLQRVAFVGGCTTGLLVTDELAQAELRYTADVDLIVQIVGYAQWHQLQSQLRQRGFSDVMDHQAPICALALGSLRVDFMPDDEKLLGFSNRWYKQAYETAQCYELDPTAHIRLVTPPYFLATKLEAYKGRGAGDPLTSQDIEDVLILLDGRKTLIHEVTSASALLKRYFAEIFRDLLGTPSMCHAIEAASQGDAGRESRLYKTIHFIIDLGEQ